MTYLAIKQPNNHIVITTKREVKRLMDSSEKPLSVMENNEMIKRMRENGSYERFIQDISSSPEKVSGGCRDDYYNTLVMPNKNCNYLVKPPKDEYTVVYSKDQNLVGQDPSTWDYPIYGVDCYSEHYRKWFWCVSDEPIVTATLINEENGWLTFDVNGESVKILKRELIT